MALGNRHNHPRLMGPDDVGAWDPCAVCGHGRWRHHHGACTEFVSCACEGRFAEPAAAVDEDDGPRFWACEVDVMQPSTHPFAEQTVQIVDEQAGGAVAYVHTANADWITAALTAAAGNSTAGINTASEDALRASIAALDFDTRAHVARIIETVDKAERHQRTLAEIYARLAAYHGVRALQFRAVGVVFRATFTHDGWHLPRRGRVLYTDAASSSDYEGVEIDFGDTLGDILRRGWSVVDSRTRLVVDLRSDTITTDRDNHLTLYLTFVR